MDLSPWQQVKLGSGFLTYRRPLVGVLALGPTRFAVANVMPSIGNADDYYSIGGKLLVREYDLETGFQGAPKIISTNFVGFIRASMSPALEVDCPPVVFAESTINTVASVSTSIINTSSKKKQSTALTSNVDTNKLMGGGYANFFVFDEKGDYRPEDGTVKLTKLLSCPGKPMKINTVTVDDGKKPSMAIGKTSSGEDQVLVVYGSRGVERKLMGRFYTSLSEPLGQPFVIFDYKGEYNNWITFSTDVIWNPVSRQFIVGFMLKEAISDLAACAILNVTISPDGTSSSPIRHGVCDASRGHPTWVDIDRRHSTNPDGVYAWYYQSDDGKNIYLMDRFGRPTGESAWFHFPREDLALEMDHTPPFAALRGPEPKVADLLEQESIASLGGDFRDQYVTALTHHPNIDEEHEILPLQIKTFSSDGRLKPHVMPTPFGGSRLRGIGTLDYHTVYIHSYLLSSDKVELILTVRRNHDPSVFTE